MEEKEIIAALEGGHLNKVKQWIKQGTLKLDQRFITTQATPLHHAALQYDTRTLEFLLQQKDVQIDIKDYNGYTPLFWAARAKLFNVVRFLIQKGANYKYKAPDGYTFFDLFPHHDMQIGIIKHMIDELEQQKQGILLRTEPKSKSPIIQRKKENSETKESHSPLPQRKTSFGFNIGNLLSFITGREKKLKEKTQEEIISLIEMKKQQ